MDGLMATLAREFGPWTLLELTEALGFILAGFILRAIVNTIVAKRLIALAEKTETKADDIASKALVSPLGLILPVVGIYLAVRTLLSVHPDWLATFTTPMGMVPRGHSRTTHCWANSQMAFTACFS